jgi:hypothetical protein
VHLLAKFGFGRWGHLPGIADFCANRREYCLCGRKMQHKPGHPLHPVRGKTYRRALFFLEFCF